ncbi:MAG: hypothetical protein Q8R92_09960 [Deltaproteobacteria bacterium]|nr:hypothetical protein [Deltaproteobacteria bacterium]
MSRRDPALDRFVIDCRRLFEVELESVFLYGSGADGEFREGLSDHNLAIVMKPVRPEALRRASRRLGTWRKWGIGTPLVLDASVLEEGMSVFPIELGEMKRAHRVLFGSDPFLSLHVGTERLRWQCEYEIQAKILSLRQAYLREAGSPAATLRIVQDSLKSFLIIMRNALTLIGESPPSRLTEVLDRVESRWGVALPTWRRVLSTRQEGGRVKRAEIHPLFAAYLDEAASLVAHFSEPIDGGSAP